MYEDVLAGLLMMAATWKLLDCLLAVDEAGESGVMLQLNPIAKRGKERHHMLATAKPTDTVNGRSQYK